MQEVIVTIQDCIDMYEMKSYAAVINDGNVVDFVKENRT